MKSCLDDLSIRQLMILIFLVEQEKQPSELEQLLVTNDFISEWRRTETRLRRLILHYPNEDEERHFLTAELEAVHNLDPYSEETMRVKTAYLPYIKKLEETYQ